jgi:hypothetical protein
LAIITLSSCHDGASAPVGDEPAARSAAQPVALRTDATGLVQTTTAKGTSIQLEGRFENAVIAHREPDGTIKTECHDDQHAAEAFMQGASASAAKLEVK